MKNLLTTTLVTILCTFALYGQCDLENPSFEDWSLVPFELDPGNGTIYQNDLFLPDSTTSPIRILFIAFGSFGNPTYGQILESDPQGLIGINQSTDASDGDFAVKLQAGYDLPVADLYFPTACSEIPDSFSVDVKHVGAFEDTLSIFVVYDEGLGALPQDTSDLQNYPAYAFGSFYYDSDTPYHTVSLPIIENFDAPIDTFYYLILAETNDSSYFLIDNLQTVEGDDPVLCSFDNYPPFSLTQTDAVCLCDDLATNDGIEGTFFTDFVDQDTVPPAFLVVNASDEILYNSGQDFNALFEVDFCPLEEMYLVQILYENEDDIGGAIVGNNLSEITGCHAVSERLAINTIFEEFDFEMTRNGEILYDQDTVVICPFDDILEVFDFTSSTNLVQTILILDEDSEEVVHQFSNQDDLSVLEPGDYVLGMIASKDSIPNYIGQVIEYSIIDPCFYASDNFYELRVLDLGEDGCLTYTEDPEVLSSLQIIQNPVSEVLDIRVAIELNKELELSIIDMNGRSLLKYDYNGINGDISIDVSSFASGVYFLHANSPDGSANFKFVKQ